LGPQRARHRDPHHRYPHRTGPRKAPRRSLRPPHHRHGAGSGIPVPGLGGRLVNRPLYVWAIFAGSVAAVLAGLFAITQAALDLARAQSAMRREAAVEEAARLALWRMDSALAPIVGTEYAWPFLTSPTDSDREPGPPPIPLAPYVRARFLLTPGGDVRFLGADSEGAIAAFRESIDPAVLRAALEETRESEWLYAQGLLTGDRDAREWRSRSRTLSQTVTVTRSNNAS